MTTPPMQSLWLRCETKPFEHRAALTPSTAKALIQAGFKITVERDPQRIFDDEEYEKVGCTLAEHSSWVDAPLDTPIIGLKELPVSTMPLKHTHIQFAHCYKHQGGWREVLMRFYEGKGTLYDLEFLQDENGRRVAAFGYHAGFAGAAVGALSWSKNGKITNLEPYENETAMIAAVKSAIAGVPPKVMVMGALGRCGRGAVDLFKAAGIPDENILKWDMAETAKGGPFEEILDVDVFINCIYLSSKIPPFVTLDQIYAAGPKRRLACIVDVSCDTTNPNNPLPVYTVNTDFREPILLVPTGEGNSPLQVCSIDHLPTLLPREASEQFSRDLLPSLKQLPNRHEARVWKEAEALFREKVAEALAN
ncbi:Formate/glycerate dehydrogenase catalytic domain-like protein [Calocera viscosa TUFC12733]|uniref:Saccharopine dehydrogenase [NAD(+), L-lysine-forming] n=1 Tax=Calocera viscosa (strain TUFC12733) TaxID=1330018 RepID=A0A167LTN7_CALVF|nr:Formate/glycerate dehydrogenase catalytic domain-like protein [Calocera viscosa TUFC12733]